MNSSIPTRWRALAATAAAALPALAACSAASLPSDSAGAGLAVIVGTAADWPSAQAVAGRAARIAAVPVTGVSRITPRLWSLTLRCTDDAACEQARQRLAAEPSFATSVEPSLRRSLPPQPPASQAY